MRFFHTITAVAQSTKSLICPIGFSRFHIISPQKFHATDFSPFSQNTINFSAYPYLPRENIPGYKPSLVEQYSRQGAQMLFEEKWDKAYLAYHQRLKLEIDEYGAQHKVTMQAREDLATALLTLGRLREAREILSNPIMGISIDSWQAYHTAGATLDFLLGEQRSALEQLQQQFELLNTSPVHPTAFCKRYGLVVVANNLGVISNQLEMHDDSHHFFMMAKKWAEKIRKGTVFLDIVNSNYTPGAPVPGCLLSHA